MSEASKESLDRELKAFQEWVDGIGKGVGNYHYPLGDTVGASMLPEHRQLLQSLIDSGIPPREAAHQSIASVVSFAFQLGYDFRRQTDYDLEQCKCERSAEEAFGFLNRDDTPPGGMYL